MIDAVIPKTEKRNLRYDFTAKEIYELSVELANETRKLSSLNEEKKSVMSQYTARINEVKASTNKLSNHVADGYTIREVECEIEFHAPEQGMKTITRRDTGQSIVEKMTEYEWNLFNQPGDE